MLMWIPGNPHPFTRLSLVWLRVHTTSGIQWNNNNDYSYITASGSLALCAGDNVTLCSCEICKLFVVKRFPSRSIVVSAAGSLFTCEVNQSGTTQTSNSLLSSGECIAYGFIWIAYNGTSHFYKRERTIFFNALAAVTEVQSSYIIHLFSNTRQQFLIDGNKQQRIQSTFPRAQSITIRSYVFWQHRKRFWVPACIKVKQSVLVSWTSVMQTDSIIVRYKTRWYEYILLFKNANTVNNRCYLPILFQMQDIPGE